MRCSDRNGLKLVLESFRSKVNGFRQVHLISQYQANIEAIFKALFCRRIDR